VINERLAKLRAAFLHPILELRCGQILKRRACGYIAIKSTKTLKMTLNPQNLIN